jgi:hypothetical protein
MEETGSTPSSRMTHEEFCDARDKVTKFQVGEHTVVCFTGVEHTNGRVHLLVQPLGGIFLQQVADKLHELFGHIPGVRISLFQNYSYVVQLPIND